jgi:DNA-binding Lrp family transcriptional regulator
MRNSKPFKYLHLLSLKKDASRFCVFVFNGAPPNCQEIFPIPTDYLILSSSQDKVYFMDKLTLEQNKVARLIQEDIKVVSSPFAEIGDSCGLTAGEVLRTTKDLLKKGFIRKFCAILRHQRAGYKNNAMVVWSVPTDQVEKAGQILSASRSVSHCYERNPAFQGKYNIFTMLHSQDEKISELSKEIAKAIGIHDYLILESIQEYKKKSPEYF